jgi:hypothetical protein
MPTTALTHPGSTLLGFAEQNRSKISRRLGKFQLSFSAEP